jgi:predicted NAD/FAD-binding protein
MVPHDGKPVMSKIQRIAVVGSGISGLASAWLLGRRHAVTLYEANDYLGGHTHTHDVRVGGRDHRVDTGFIVFNPTHYPLLTRLFDELGVRSQPTQMSLSVRNETSGLEYNATSLATLFCQRRNLFSPRFFGLIRDILRFNREARALLAVAGPGPTLGDYLARNRYGAAFRDEHLVPMSSALWSAPPREVLEFPAKYLVQFLANHEMLQVTRRAPWRVVQGGSSTYIQALTTRWNVTARLGCPVLRIERSGGHVTVESLAGRERYDQVVLACHSDQALELLSAPTRAERDILGAIGYQPNRVLLHTDASVMPQRPRAWAAWNALIPQGPATPCTVSYWMNLLQGIDSAEPLIVTLNPTRPIDPAKVLRSLHYAHPAYTQASVAARARKAEIQGARRIWFAGAYWGWGFHEDGMRSAVDVAAALGVAWPVRAAHPARLAEARELAA